MDIKHARLVGVVGLLLALPACDLVEANDFDAEAIEFRDGGGRSAPPADDDGTSRGGGGEWLSNGLTNPAVSGVDVDYPLNSSDGLSHDWGWLAAEDDEGFDAIKHMVECALDQEQTVKKNYKGDKVTFHGRLGLAPEWRSSACDGDCQQWVSACMLARTNPTGETVDLWVEGDHAEFGFGSHPDFPLHEAVFYGNLFAPTPVKHSCVGEAAGQQAAQDVGRTCSSGTDPECGFVSDGDCMLDADCDVSPSGDVTACRDGSGTAYHAVTVHLGEVQGQ